MRRLLLSLILIASITTLSAQTDPALAGLHQAETAPGFAYTGSWVELVDSDYVVMESATADDSVSFQFVGSGLIIYRETLPALETPAIVEVCIDSDCQTITNETTIYQQRVPIAFNQIGQATHDLTITNTDGGVFRLDYVIVTDETGLVEAVAPNPTAYYLVLESGQIVAVDFTINGGDIAQIILLTYLCSMFTYRVVIARTDNHE